MTLDLPSSLTGEVTLIGTGGGYGESVIIHMGCNYWIVIDSCINPKTQTSLPLWYLKQIGIDVVNDVKMILCTHWHDDHLRGLSQLLRECKNANFCMAEVSDKRKFLQFVSLDYQKLKDRAISDTSTKEFNLCLEIAKVNGNKVSFAKENTILQSFPLTSTLKSQLFALSPSDYTIACFFSEISTLITDYGSSNKKIPVNSPNAKSVALYLKLGEHAIILGSDLEVSEDKREGWDNILDTNLTIDKKASLLKISHHGSENGYHIRVFDELMSLKPIANLTPWNKKKKLPQTEMMLKYLGHSSSVYITSPISITEKAKKRDRETEKLLAKFKVNIREIPYELGIVRNRINLIDSTDVWETEVHDAAFLVTI